MPSTKSHCVHGHPWSAENTYVCPKGFRACRACFRARWPKIKGTAQVAAARQRYREKTYRGIILPMPDRFWSKVDKTSNGNGCWLWTPNHNGKGYGQFYYEERMQMAHRVAFIICVGEIPNGMQIDHLCRNRRCVNPDHLEAVTVEENLRRAMPFIREARIRAGQTRERCKHGHEWIAANITVNKNGTKTCRICHVQYMKEYYKKFGSIRCADRAAHQLQGIA